MLALGPRFIIIDRLWKASSIPRARFQLAPCPPLAMLGVARGIRAGLRIRWVAPRRVGTGQPWWRRPMSSASALRDVNDAASTLGEALRELEMLADEEGDGGVSTLPGPISARHELASTKWRGGRRSDGRRHSGQR